MKEKIKDTQMIIMLEFLIFLDNLKFITLGDTSILRYILIGLWGIAIASNIALLLMLKKVEK